MKNIPEIDSTRIGLFGSSQAGYVMPIAVSRCKDISFMIGSSLTGESSIEQWNYLIEKQMICEGYSEEKAKQNAEMFNILRCTPDKSEFDKAAGYFERNPMIIKSIGYDSSFSQNLKDRWPHEIDENDESHFNPITLVYGFNIPVFLVYGENDTQIDPYQAMTAYKKALSHSETKLYKIKMLKDCDHNMSLTNSGCLTEISELIRAGNYRYSPEYFEVIKEWINLVMTSNE